MCIRDRPQTDTPPAALTPPKKKKQNALAYPLDADGQNDRITDDHIGEEMCIRDRNTPGANPQWYLDNARYVNSNIVQGHVRFALMATHTREQVEQAVQILKKIFVEEGIIK